MSGVPTFEWSIEDVIAAHPDLFLDHCAAMAVALLGKLSAPPCEFFVECDGFQPADLDGRTSFVLRVGWADPTAQRARRVRLTEQAGPIVERAAVALAALCFAHLIPDSQMRVTRHGERADYWLPKLNRAVEISGTEQVREVAGRVREKAAQVLDNPLQWDGYAFVCCFGESHRLIRWSFHTQRERADESP